MNLYTIGFTKKCAKEFFELLIKNNIKTVIDTRLNNKSQLAGFTKQDDFKYFLEKIGSIKYVYKLEWAPSKEMLDNFKKKKINWEEYKSQYLALLSQRNITNGIDFMQLDGACLLCSEEKPNYCHRRLLAEYLEKSNRDISIVHL